MSVIVLGDYLLGKWELLKVASRSSTVDISDSTVTSTFETADLTSLAGTDVAGLIVAIYHVTASANDRSILAIREVGDTVASTSVEARTSWLAAEQGANSLVKMGFYVVPARGTDPGKFQYAEESASIPIDTLEVVYWGRVRP